MASIDELKGLSPGALRIFKEQAEQRASQGDINFSRLVSSPEYQSLMSSLPMTSPTMEAETKDKAWYEYPLEWMRNVEKGAGTILAAPFTPGVQGTEGMPWFQREQAEYEAWEEPSFQVDPLFRLPWTPQEVRDKLWNIGVKGVIEQVPWFATTLATAGLGGLGWVGAKTGLQGITKAARFGRGILNPIQITERAITNIPIKIAGKAISPITSQLKNLIPKEPIVEKLMEATGQWVLPDESLLNEAYKEGGVRAFSQWAENKPILGTMMKALGGESIFVDAKSQLPKDVVRRSTVNRARLLNIGANLEGSLLPRLRKLGNPKDILGIGDDGLLSTVVSKDGKASRYLMDVIENPSNYEFANPLAEQYVKEFTEIRSILKEMLEKEGLKQNSKVHRIVEGIITEDGKVVKSKFGSDPTLSRVYETMEDAVLAHKEKGQQILYGLNPNEVMSYEIDRTINRIARKRFSDTVKKLGRVPKEIWAETYPKEAETLGLLYAKKNALKNAQGVLQRMLSYKAGTVPGATLAKVRKELSRYAPEIARNIDNVFSMKKPNVEKIIKDMSDEVGSALKMKPKELKSAVKVIRDVNVTWRDKKVINLSDIDDAVKNLNLDKEAEKRVIEKAYTESYKANKKEITKFIKANRDVLGELIDETKNAINPLSKDRSKFLQSYAGRERLPHKAGEVAERPFNSIPEFRNKFFPDDITTYLEKHYHDDGTAWLRTMGSVSAMSRNLTAVLDDSAPFIQGLFVFGRNPVEWAKATAKQFEFFIKPENFNKYMAKPEIQALHTEMVKAGSTIQAFELVEAIPQIERLAAKIPGVGKVAEGFVKQTYGRAEAAFTGFGQVARDNMWKSLRRPGMNEGQLQELARTLDLMTGNISTSALGISRTQRDIEASWVFFSPRFTRASLAFVGDAFRGGMAGAEARKSIIGLMTAGTAMYYGICKATGQEPNLDPSSGRFMTVKVGDDFVGVGGILYSLARLAGNLTTVEDPTDLLKFDRFDNPFIKFMYGKSAPLTGMAVGAFEQQDYLGRPFESASDWGRFLSEKVLPFSIQPLLEEEKPGATSFAAQFAGLRTFPEGLGDKRTELRESYSTERYGKTYKELTKLEQKQIDKSDDIKELTQRMREEGRETPEALVWNRWNEEGASIEDIYRETITNASNEFRVTGDGITFKDKVDTAKQVRREMYARRSISPDYSMIQEYFSLPKSQEKINNTNPLDTAREDYYTLMYSPSMYDQFGNYNHQLADQKEQWFVKNYGQEALNYIEQYEGSSWDGTPELQQFNQAKDILEPYWAVENRIWANYPAELKQISDRIKILERTDNRAARIELMKYPQIVFIRKQIARQKKILKMQRPDIANALSTYYSY